MSTVWVIEQGSYSDYRVSGVFTTKENAQMVCDAINAGDNCYDTATLAEWPLDPAIDALNQGLNRYFVQMLRDGTVERIESKAGLATYPSLADYFEEWRREGAPHFKGKPNVLQAYVWAENDKHAIKIVNERRIQMLANNQWEGKL